MNETRNSQTPPGTLIKFGEPTDITPEVPEFLVPQALIQPPDYFKGENGTDRNREIEQLVQVGDWKFVVIPQGVQAVDSAGNIISLPPALKIPKRLTDREFLTEAVARTVSGKPYVTVKPPGEANPDEISIPSVMRSIDPSIDEKTAIERSNSIRSRFSIWSSNHAILATNLTPEKIDLVNNDRKICSMSPTGDNKLVVSVDNRKFEITVNGDPAEWSAKKVDEVVVPSQEVPLDSSIKIKIYPNEKARLLDGNGRQLLVLPDKKPSPDPEDNSTVWYVENGKVVNLDTKKLSMGSYEPQYAELPPEVANCRSVSVDKNGNFIVVAHDGQEGGSVTIFDKKSLTPVESFNVIATSPEIDRDGNIIFVDQHEQLRVISTNFKFFPKGYGTQISEIQERKIQALRSQIANLELPEVDIGAAMENVNGSEVAANTVEGVLVELNQKLTTMFMPQLEGAANEADIQKLKLQLQTIKNRPEFQQYPIASESIERAMDTKSAQLKAVKLETGVVSLASQIPTISSLEGSISLTKELERLQNLRGEINFMLLDPEASQALQQRLKQIEGQVKTIQSAYQGELVNQLQGGLEEVGHVLGNAETLMELEEARKDPTVRQYLERLNLVSDSKQRAEIRRRWGSLLEKKQQEIEATRMGRSEDKRARAAEIAGDIESSFRSLARNVEGILRESNGKINIAAWKEGSASVAELREQIRHLPGEYQQAYLNRIEEIIIQKQKEAQQQKAGEKKETRTQGATVKLGKESFPVYQIPLVHVTPGWIPLTKGMTSKDDRGQLVFQSTKGEVWKTGEVMKMDVNSPQHQQVYEDLRKKAEQRFNPKRNVPEIPSEMVLTPSQEKTLETMARLFRRQLGLNKDLVRERRPRGITIMQGDAGVGKDFSIEVFAALTNREIVSVPCRFSMDPEDITSEYRFNPKKGTFRVPSQFAQALTKAGTIVNFIEINTMPPEVSKMLNSVFDFKRTLYFTQGADPDSVELNLDGVGQEIKVNEDVVFVGTMNPENYIGTRPLPQEFKSRARFMDVDYPPYRVGKRSTGEEERLPVEQTSVPSGFTEMKISPDEAMILAKQIDSLRTLTADEFSRLWDHKVNREAGNGADMFDNPERTKAIDNLNQVVKIANKMRQAYRSFHTNEPGADVFEFVFSLRESQDIVAELAESGSVKEAVMEVVLPKISDPEQRKRAQDIIKTS